MALADLLELSRNKQTKKIGISEERLKAAIPIGRKYIAFWREYPDIFVEFLCGDNPENFHLYNYQKILLRAAMRHRYVYATFPRAYSKSFLAVLILILRCILFPGSHLFVTSGGKEQAAGILKEKGDLICKYIPGIRNEINWGRGKSKTSKEDYCLLFKNGSVLDVMAGTARSRGRRATGGCMEEVILIDQTILNEIIIPTMNVDRLLANGKRDPEEVVNKSQLYITTAGLIYQTYILIGVRLRVNYSNCWNAN